MGDKMSRYSPALLALGALVAYAAVLGWRYAPGLPWGVLLVVALILVVGSRWY
jgi:hypothetical protein